MELAELSDRTEINEALNRYTIAVDTGECNPGRQQAVLRKRVGPPKRQRELGAEPLEIAPHVAALGGVKIERRCRPPLGLENRSEQEWAKAHVHTGLPRQRSDSHGRGIGIGRGEIEPELEHRSRHCD